MKLELKKTALVNLSQDDNLMPAELTAMVAGGSVCTVLTMPTALTKPTADNGAALAGTSATSFPSWHCTIPN